MTEPAMSSMFYNQFDSALASLGMFVWQFEYPNDILTRSRRWESILGYGTDELCVSFEDWFLLVHLDDQRLVKEKFYRHFNLKRNSRYQLEYRIKHAHGFWMWVEEIVTFSIKDNYKLVTGIIKDITERKQLEFENQKQQELLKAQKLQLELSIDSAQLGVWDMNAKTGQVDVNHIWRDMIGFPSSEVVTYKKWKSLVHVQDLEIIQREFQEHLSGKSTSFKYDYRIKHHDGYWVWLYSHGKIIDRDLNGNPNRICGIHQNISKRKQSEEEYRYYSEHDALTNLFNKLVHDRDLRHLSRKSEEVQQNIIVAIIDIDFFKTFNDNYGHHLGDVVLNKVAQVIAAHTNANSKAYRIGGEEFSIIYTSYSKDEVYNQLDILRLQIKAIDLHAIDERIENSQITVTIGMSEMQKYTTYKCVMLNADKALYQGKRQGRNQIIVY